MKKLLFILVLFIPSVLFSHDSSKLVKNVIKALDLDTKQYNFKNISYLISSLKNKMIYPIEYEKITSEYREIKIAKIYEKYQNDLKESNAVDFDDLLLLPLEIFKKFPEKLSEYQNKYQYFQFYKRQNIGMNH